MTPTLTKLALLGTAACTAFGLSAAHAADSAVIEWNIVALEAVRIARPAPTVVARSLAVLHTCIYDAWAAYDAKAVGTQLGGTLRQPAAKRTEENKITAINAAAYRALVDLWPAQAATFADKLSNMGGDPHYVATDQQTVAGVGNAACAAVIAFRHADGSNQLGDLNGGARYSDYTGYTPVNTPDVIIDGARWQPLLVGGVAQKFATPQWGKVKPFALKSVDEYRIKTPAAAGSSEYKAQVDQVLGYSANLTDREKVIAEYWADGPASELPPGHWNLIAQSVSRRDGFDLDRDAQMFFALNGALLDSSVWVWGVKVKYDYARPVTSVTYQYGADLVTAWSGPNMGTQPIPANTWQPYQPVSVVTPPFAEYVSGHSTFSAAAATVLKLVTGSDSFGGSVTIATGTSAVEPGSVPASPLTLSWATFTEAADEAGISRLYGGIHFEDGDLEGRRVGKQIGQAAFDLASKLIAGAPRKGRK